MKKLSKLLLLFIICTLWSVSAHAQQNVTASLTTQATACASPPVSGASGYVYVIQNAGNGGGAIAVSGTWSGTLSFFRGVKQSNSTTVIWSALSTTDATPVSTTTANGTWQVNTAGYTDICVAFTTASSGTAVVTINLGQASARSNGGGGDGGISIAATQLAGGSGINTVGAVPGWTFGTTTGEDIDCLGGTTCAEILSDTAGDDTAINSNSLTRQNSLAMNGTTATQDASGNLDISSPIVVTGAVTATSLNVPGGSTGNASIVAQSAAGTPTLTLPTGTGTFAVTASAPLALNAGTGALSVSGSAGQIPNGSTGAFTATPALGTDNSVAGTLQTANGSSNAHTIWGSAATTSNTIKGFATAPTTTDIVTCVTATTVCTLTDSGIAVASNKIAISAVGTSGLSGSAPMAISAAGAISCATCVTSASSLTSTALMTGGGSQASQTPSATSTLSAGGALALAGSATTTGLVLTGSAPSVTATGTTPYINASGPLIQRAQCSFALTTSTLTLALSPVNLCTLTLPNAAVVWRVNCQGGWSVPAGTTPTFAVGNNWAQTPSGVFAGANIGTTNAGVAVEGTTSSTSNGNIVATGSLTTSATIFPVTWWSTFTGSATSGAYHPTASLTGTSATGTLVGFCTIE